MPISTLAQDFTLDPGITVADVGKFVSLDGDTSVVLADGTADELGVLTDVYADGTGTVMQLGNADLIVGADVVAGDVLGSDALGQGVTGGTRCQVLTGALTGGTALVSLLPPLSIFAISGAVETAVSKMILTNEGTVTYVDDGDILFKEGA